MRSAGSCALAGAVFKSISCITGIVLVPVIATHQGIRVTPSQWHLQPVESVKKAGKH